MRTSPKARFAMKMFVIDCMFLFFKITMMTSKFPKTANMEINPYKTAKSDNTPTGTWNGLSIFSIWLAVKFEILFTNISKDVSLLFTQFISIIKKNKLNCLSSFGPIRCWFFFIIAITLQWLVKPNGSRWWAMLSINWFLFFILHVVCTEAIHLTQQEKNI